MSWERFPLIACSRNARTWLTIQVNLGLAVNTVQAYGRSLEEYFSFCSGRSVAADIANREHIAAFVRVLATRPHPRSSQLQRLGPNVGQATGLANATLQQRVTALRLYYDYLIEEGLRPDNPGGRGHYTARKGFGGYRERALIPHYHKSRQERVVPYSEATSLLLSTYLQHRRNLSRERGRLFLSESRRNRSQPISIWTWSKVIAGIALRSGVRQLTTHTMRHLCLTDLARAGWDIHEIATFAGHRSTQTTLLYIHLSGRELAAKFERSMASLHAWRIQMMEECWRD